MIHSETVRLADEAFQCSPVRLSSRAAATRRHWRQSIHVEVTLQSRHNLYCGFAMAVNEGMRETGITSNLSEGGLFIATLDPLPIGTVLTVSFSLPGVDDLLVEEVRVSWCREHTSRSDAPAGMGVAFVDLQPTSAAALRAFLAMRAPFFYPGHGR
jgi:uncharacterized protein (TIGR02266 family)